MKKLFAIFGFAFALVAGVAIAQQVNIYTEQGGRKMVVASGGELEIQSGGLLDVQSGAGLQSPVETVAAANTITAAESGATFILSSATEFASTLPAPAAGLNYMFIIGAAPSGAAYTVVSNGGADVIILLVNELETDTTNDGPYDDNADTVTFADGVSVVGDWLQCVSDGTSWFCRGSTNADGGITSSTT